MTTVPCSRPDAVLAVTHTGVLRLNRQLIDKTRELVTWLQEDKTITVAVGDNLVCLSSQGPHRLARNGKGLAVNGKHLATLLPAGGYRLKDFTATQVILEKENALC